MHQIKSLIYRSGLELAYPHIQLKPVLVFQGGP